MLDASGRARDAFADELTGVVALDEVEDAAFAGLCGRQPDLRRRDALDKVADAADLEAGRLRVAAYEPHDRVLVGLVAWRIIDFAKALRKAVASVLGEA